VVKYIFISFILITQLLLSETLTGKVITVKDGDTIDILIEKTTYIIRLDGVDAPEKAQAFGQKAKQFTSDFCFGKVVTAEVSSKDRYGRNLGKVYLDGKCLNEELLRNGFAWHYKHYNKEKKLAELELSAKSQKLGLWIDKDPTPPWDFRKDKKAVIKEKSDVQKADAVYDTDFVGNSNSMKFHKVGCKSVKDISGKNAVEFETREKAVEAGYKPCKACNP